MRNQGALKLMLNVVLRTTTELFIRNINAYD